MNPLDQYPEVRKYLYMLQWVVNGILAIAGIWFTLDGKDIADLPQWYVFTAGIAPFLWTYLGITAQVNTPVGQGTTPADLAEAEAEGKIDDGKHRGLPDEEIPPAEPVVLPPDPDDPTTPPMYPDKPS